MLDAIRFEKIQKESFIFESPPPSSDHCKSRGSAVHIYTYTSIEEGERRPPLNES